MGKLPENPFPVYAEYQALREEQARFRRKFDACKDDLEQLEKLLAAEKQAGTLGKAHWLHWIVRQNGPLWDWHGSEESWQRGVRIIEDLITSGASFAATGEGWHRVDALADLVEWSPLPIDQRARFLALAIQHGADPCRREEHPVFDKNTREFVGWWPTKSALDAALESVDSENGALDLLREIGPRDELTDAYYQKAINDVPRPKNDAALDETVARAGDLSRPIALCDSMSIGTFVHFMCDPQVPLATFERYVDRIDVNQPLPGPHRVEVTHRFAVSLAFRSNDVIPCRWFESGSTPLDIVDGILDALECAALVQERTKCPQFDSDSFTKLLTNTEAKRACLVAHGGVSKVPFRATMRPEIASTAKELARIFERLGHDPTSLHAVMNWVGSAYPHTGAWNFLGRVVPCFAKELLSTRLRASPMLGHLLGGFVKRKAVGKDVASFATDTWKKSVAKSRLPKSIRADVEQAVLMRKDGDDIYALVGFFLNGEFAKEVWKISGENVTVLAPNFESFLRAEVSAWIRAETGEPEPARGDSAEEPSLRSALDPEALSPLSVPKRPFGDARAIFKRAFQDAHEDHDLSLSILGLDEKERFVVGDVDAHDDAEPLKPFLGRFEMNDGFRPEDREVWSSPDRFITNVNFDRLLALWNTSGKASFVPVDGGGFLAVVEFGGSHDDDDSDAFSFGEPELHTLLIGVWEGENEVFFTMLPSSKEDVLKEMMGLGTWPERFRTVEVFYGE